MRVYELAEKLGMESRKLIPALLRLGSKVTSDSTILDDQEVQRALEALGAPARPRASEERPQKEAVLDASTVDSG